MKQYLLVCLTLAILLTCGCSLRESPEISPEAKVDIAHFIQHDIKSYVQSMVAPVDLDRMVNDFSFVAEKWEEIENKHSLKNHEVVRVNDAISLQKLMLIYHEGSQIDVDSLSAEEGRSSYQLFNSKREKLMEHISEAYWDHLLKQLNTPSYPSDIVGTLDIIKTSPWPSRLEGHENAFAELMTANLMELISSLKLLME